MTYSHAYALRTAAPRQQQGLALMVALIALVAMTLAGVALVRSIDTNALIAGNLAFRQSATMSAEQGIEAAIKTLQEISPAQREQDQESQRVFFYLVQDAGWSMAKASTTPATAPPPPVTTSSGKTRQEMPRRVPSLHFA